MAKKSRYVPWEERPTEDIMAEVDGEFRRWEHIHDHGCQDPHWEDGVNMNLVRNHIIYFYRILKDRISDQFQTSMFGVGFEPESVGLRPVPPEMPNSWMCPTGDYPNRLDRRNHDRRTGF